MARKTDFTEDEWKELQQGVTGAGLLVSAAHRDFTDTFGEAKAVASELSAHRESDSELVRDLAGSGGSGFGAFASPKEVLQETIDALGAPAALFRKKAPDELDAYRALVLDVATRAAEAKGGVKDEETAAIERIREALGAGGT